MMRHLALCLVLVACGGTTGSDPDGGPAGVDARVSGTDGGGTITPLAEFAFCDETGSGNVVDADPSNYRARLDALGPGDTLRLAAGTYDRGLPIHDLDGAEDNCIVIEGPASGGAVFTGSSSRNTVSISNASYIVVRNLELQGDGELGDGVKAEGTSSSAHHIVLENLTIEGHGNNQQVVGISTKCPAWYWVIRGNVIRGAGTGMYLGNSDGSAPFVAGLVENNLVVDTIGYNMQVKHQNDRPLAAMPSSAQTVIRHNVFSKANGGSSGGSARPNLLVGHWPLSGPGSGDMYLIYGNYFHQNPNEALFQGEGNVALYSNVFINDGGAAVNIQPHNDVPRQVRVFHNTVYAQDRSIRVSGADSSASQDVVGNATFAGSGGAISGGDQRDNITAERGQASTYVTAPTATPPDLHPLGDALDGNTIDTSAFDSLLDADLDFDGAARSHQTRGAYTRPGGTPWPLALARKWYP